VYVSLGVTAAFGFYHAPLVQGDLNAIALGITGPDLRFRIGVVSAGEFPIMLWLSIKGADARRESSPAT
jgi:hypothetical protein